MVIFHSKLLNYQRYPSGSPMDSLAPIVQGRWLGRSTAVRHGEWRQGGCVIRSEWKGVHWRFIKQPKCSDYGLWLGFVIGLVAARLGKATPTEDAQAFWGTLRLFVSKEDLKNGCPACTWDWTFRGTPETHWFQSPRRAATPAGREWLGPLRLGPGLQVIFTKDWHPLSLVCGDTYLILFQQ